MWNSFLAYLNQNKDALSFLFGSGVVLAILGGIFKFVLWVLKDQRKKKVRSDKFFPFKVFPPNSNLVNEILRGDDNDPLADKNIPYQERITGRNIRREVESILIQNPRILLLGKTGIGKTREALNIAQSLNNEGWTILFLTRDTWLSAPSKLPEGVPDRKLLFILDDLNRKIYGSRVEQRPDAAENLFQPFTAPLQERLSDALSTFEKLCGKNEILVIATARNEKVRDYGSEPSEWEKLEINKYQGFWKEFTFFEIPEPENSGLVNLLEEVNSKVNVIPNSEEYQKLVNRNDGTFSNLIANLRNARSDREPLTTETFIDTLKGTWKNRYLRALSKYPNAPYVYYAITTLRILLVDLYKPLIVSTCLKFLGKKSFRKVLDRFQIETTLNYLIKTENILLPRDGQLEAAVPNREVTVPVEFLLFLVNEISKYSNKIENPTISLLFIFYMASNMEEYKIAAYALEKVMKIPPVDILFIRALSGIYREKLNRSADCIPILQKALSIDPHDSLSYHEMAHALIDLKRYDEALECFYKAIELQPNHTGNYVCLGRFYFSIDKADEAIKAFTKATEINPEEFDAWDELGRILQQLERYEEALYAFTKAIINRSNSQTPTHKTDIITDEEHKKCESTYHQMAHVLEKLGREEESVEAFQNAIVLDPNNDTNYYCLGKLYVDLNSIDAAISAFNKAIEINPEKDEYNHLLGHAYSAKGLIEDAIQAFKKSIEIATQNSENYLCLGNLYFELGSIEDAAFYLNRAYELDNSLDVWQKVAILYLLLDRYEDAKSIMSTGSGAELLPILKDIANICIRFERFENAYKAYLEAIELDPENGVLRSSFISVLHHLDKSEEAQYQEVIARPLIEKESEYNRACFEANCGHSEEALHLLQIALEQKQVDIDWVREDLDFESLRSNPAFIALVGENNGSSTGQK